MTRGGGVPAPFRQKPAEGLPFWLSGGETRGCIPPRSVASCAAFWGTLSVKPDGAEQSGHGNPAEGPWQLQGEAVKPTATVGASRTETVMTQTLNAQDAASRKSFSAI